MNGVMSLMQGPQGQQGPMPGQAPQQPMPGMMPQQGAPTPGAMTGSLKNMPLDQLKMMYQNPQPNSPPLWAVISALAEKQKEAQAMQMAQGQQAMAQNAQMQQQPPVAAQVMQAADQQPVMAAYGGEMHGYAGGGAVSFANGGRTYGYAPDYEEARQLGINLSPYDPPEIRAEKLERLRIARETGEVPPPGEKEIASRKDVEGIGKALKFSASPFVAAGAAAADVAGMPINLLRKYSLPGVSTGEESLTPVMDMLRRQEPAKGSGRGSMTPPMAASEEGQRLAERINAPTAFALDANNPQALNALRRAAMTAGGQEREDLLAQIAQMQAQLQQSRSMAEPSRAFASATQENRPSQSGVASLAKPQATLTPEEEQYFANKASTLRTRQGLPEDVLSGRQGIASLAAENLAAQRAEREQMAREAKEQRDVALARSQRGIMDDPMSLLALAGSIDTRRGQGVGSLARGAAGLLGKREEQAEAARKEYALSQRDQRMLQANERQANMLEMQRQQAIRENDVPRVSQIEDQLAALEMQKSQLLRSRQEHAEKIGLEERRVGAMEADAAAKMGRPTEIDFYREDPVGYGKFQAARRGPQTAGERQDLAKLNSLIASLKDQADITKNYDKASREQASVLLKRAQARLAQMSGIDGAPMPTGGAVRPSSQAEFDALPKGARYINPADGKEYTKN